MKPISYKQETGDIERAYTGRAAQGPALFHSLLPLQYLPSLLFKSLAFTVATWLKKFFSLIWLISNHYYFHN